MSNELVLIVSMFAIYSLVLVCFRFLGKQGLCLWTVTSTIIANVEVLILIHAFGMDMTLGNILFASSLLATDLIGEFYGKEDSKKAVMLGVYATIIFLIVSSSWHLYSILPESALGVQNGILSQEPRVLLAGVAVYVVSLLFDIWCYHGIWGWTTKLCGNRRSFLWARSLVSTLLAQAINAFMFNFAAFYGVYGSSTVWHIAIASAVIYFVTSVVSTPFMYIARKIAGNRTKFER